MTKIIGILNITPDSTSDIDGYFEYDPISDVKRFICHNTQPTQEICYDACINNMKKMINDGAEIIDIGAVATNYKLKSIVSESLEMNRLMPILSNLIKIAHDSNVEVSLDTFNPATIKYGIEQGVDYINEVSGLKHVCDVLLKSRVKIICMHSLSLPADITITLAQNENTIDQLLRWFTVKLQELQNLGIERGRIIMDPGIGFGKTAKQSWDIIRGVAYLQEIQYPICIGHSRKSFLGISNLQECDIATANVTENLANKGIDYVRVHNVEMTRKILN